MSAKETLPASRPKSFKSYGGATALGGVRPSGSRRDPKEEVQQVHVLVKAKETGLNP